MEFHKTSTIQLETQLAVLWCRSQLFWFSFLGDISLQSEYLGNFMLLSSQPRFGFDPCDVIHKQ